MGAISKHGHAFLGNGSKYHLSALPLRHGLFRHRVDDFQHHVVLVHVHAVLFQAFEGYPRPGDFRQPVQVACVDAQQLLQLLAHFLGPGFRAEAAGLQVNVLPRLQPHFPNGFPQMRGVGGGAAEHGGPHFPHHHDLPLGVAAGHGNHHGADFRGPLMRPQSAGKQAVAVANLDDVVPSAPGRRQGPGHQLGPYVHVVFGVSHHNGLAGGAGRALNPHDFRFGGGEQTVGEIVPQVGLLREGQQHNVVGRTNVLGLYALCVHPGPVNGHVVVYPPNHFPQPPALQGVPLVPAHTLHCRIPDFMRPFPRHTCSLRLQKICKIIQPSR